jgi:hypothetical protein
LIKRNVANFGFFISRKNRHSSVKILRNQIFCLKFVSREGRWTERRANVFLKTECPIDSRSKRREDKEVVCSSCRIRYSICNVFIKGKEGKDVPSVASSEPGIGIWRDDIVTNEGVRSCIQCLRSFQDLSRPWHWSERLIDSW